MIATQPLLRIKDLRVEASSAEGRVVAVRDLDLEVFGGERVGLIGESGSGKTTTVRALIGLLERNVRITGGSIEFGGKSLWQGSRGSFEGVRGSEVGMVFQSPRASLNPLRTIGSQLREVLKVHRPDLPAEARERRIAEVMRRMGFIDVHAVLGAYPHELSGGMCQRAAIGLAIAVEPSLLLADECTSALDVTTQAEVVALIRDLVADGRRALVFVTHDLLLAADVCTRICVMYAGQIVETGTVDEVLGSPQHPYTQELLRAVPAWKPKAALAGIPGAPPRVTPEFTGCGFRERCPRAVAACAEPIEVRALGERRSARCLFAGDAQVESLR